MHIYIYIYMSVLNLPSLVVENHLAWRWGLGFGIVTPIVEAQMEIKVENEMEIGVVGNLEPFQAVPLVLSAMLPWQQISLRAPACFGQTPLKKARNKGPMLQLRPKGIRDSGRDQLQCCNQRV